RRAGPLARTLDRSLGIDPVARFARAPRAIETHGIGLSRIASEEAHLPRARPVRTQVGVPASSKEVLRRALDTQPIELGVREGRAAIARGFEPLGRDRERALIPGETFDRGLVGVGLR